MWLMTLQYKVANLKRLAVLGCELLGRWGVCGKTWWLSGEGRKSSSMSRTFARRDLEEFSFISISFILFWIRMVFLVIFSPGRDILNSQGIHWRNRIRTWGNAFEKQLIRNSSYPVWHFVGVRETMVIVEDHDGRHDAGSHHEHDAVEICAWNQVKLRTCVFLKTIEQTQHATCKLW